MHEFPVPIAIYIQLYHDGELAEHAIVHIRTSYPQARILLQSDGDDNPAYHDLALRYGCSYFMGKRLYGRESGGKMLQRMLNDYLCGGGDWMIKIDTDTRIDRPFRVLSSDRAVYGHPLKQGPPQGGCVIIPRAVAAELRDSRIFLDNRLCDAEASWGKIMKDSFLHEQLSRTDRIGFEWTLFWACEELGIPVLRHPEIHATWKQGDLNTDRHYAIVHPDKFLQVEDETIHDQCTASHSRTSDIYLQAVYNTPNP